MMSANPAAEIALLAFDEKRHGTYLGDAVFRLPSGARRRVAIYHDHGIYLGAARPDHELCIGRELFREVQIVLRAALPDVDPELFVDASP
jgi:hypothetical protein